MAAPQPEALAELASLLPDGVLTRTPEALEKYRYDGSRDLAAEPIRERRLRVLGRVHDAVDARAHFDFAIPGRLSDVFVSHCDFARLGGEWDGFAAVPEEFLDAGGIAFP